MEMRLQETHKPKLAPGTLRNQSVKNRGDLSRSDYSQVLASRSTTKLEKILRQKQENDIKEVKDCTFKPRLNKKQTCLRETSGGSQRSNRQSVFSKTSGAFSQRENYVDNYLYKPKIRQDRSTEEVEYENQKNECHFKPQTLNKHRNVAVSKIKLYI